MDLINSISDSVELIKGWIDSNREMKDKLNDFNMML